MASTTQDPYAPGTAESMLQHWLATPRFSRFGIDYGNRIPEWIHDPLIETAPAHVHGTLADLGGDIAVFGSLDVDIYLRQMPPDRRLAVFDIGGSHVIYDGGV